MGFRSLVRKLLTACLAFAISFVAINAAGVASASQAAAEQCAPWKALKKSNGEVKVCAKVLEHGVMGHAVFRGAAHLPNDDGTGIAIATVDPLRYCFIVLKRKTSISRNNLPNGNYVVHFFEGKSIPAYSSPDIKLGKDQGSPC